MDAETRPVMHGPVRPYILLASGHLVYLNDIEAFDQKDTIRRLTPGERPVPASLPDTDPSPAAVLPPIEGVTNGATRR